MCRLAHREVTTVTGLRLLPRRSISAIMRPLLLLAVIAVPALAQDDHDHTRSRPPAALGKVDFKSSANAAARPVFQHGIALLHSFEYEDAATALQDAQKRDAKFALAYWFDALTYRHPLWGTEDLGAARAALARLGPTREARLGKAHDARERMYGSAVEALFADAPEIERVSAFSDTLVRLTKRYPDDLEAAAFASLGLLAKGYLLRDTTADRATVDAIALANRVNRAKSQHPGATHYLIHAYDDPKRAQDGLPFARAYAKIAPDAEHALHMPSHIFLQVGLWDDVIASNERSWGASRAWAKSHGIPAAVDFHSLNWLQYGYLQKGRRDAARALIDTAMSVLRGSGGGIDSRYALSQLAFRFGAETGDFSAFRGLTPPNAPRDDASQRERAFARNLSYQRAIVAALAGDTAGARSIATSLNNQALTDQLDAISARANGDATREIAALMRAAEREKGQSLVGPPGTLIAHEMLGDALLRAGRPSEAVLVYEAALRRTPNRAAAVAGLARAKR
jgi:tetratricopeptide (TPR) repeat protein